MKLDDIARVCNTIASDNSRLFKEQCLRRFSGLPGLQECLKFIYSTDVPTGIGKAKLDNAATYTPNTVTPEYMMDYLTRNNTGDAADIDLCLGFIYGFENLATQRFAEALVTKDLQIGVTATTLNKVYGKGFIPKIGIMKGVPLKDVELSGVYIATEKIDGNRRLIFTKATGVEVYTRSGKRDYGLVDIMKAAESLPQGYVFDSECVAAGTYSDNIALRQASASLLNSGGQRTGVVAKIFDIIPIAEYNVGKSRNIAVIRKAILAGLFDDYTSIMLLETCLHNRGLFLHANSVNAMKHSIPHDTIHKLKATLVDLPVLEALPILALVSTKEEAMIAAQPIWDVKGEGIMLNSITAPYEVKEARCKHLVKVKATEEGQYKVAMICEGEKSFEGMLGAVVISMMGPDGLVYHCKVGSGFTFEQRIKYWKGSITGKVIEVEHFGISKNLQGGYSLSCPIFKRIVGEDE